MDLSHIKPSCKYIKYILLNLPIYTYYKSHRTRKPRTHNKHATNSSPPKQKIQARRPFTTIKIILKLAKNLKLIKYTTI